MYKGKSVFARGFVRDIINSPKEIVPSPSFLLEQTYSGVREPSGPFTVRHFDLYRLQNNITAADWEALGMREALQNDLCLVEWPEVGMCLRIYLHRLEMLSHCLYAITITAND